MNSDYDLGWIDGFTGLPVRGETEEYILGHLDGSEVAAEDR